MEEFPKNQENNVGENNGIETLTEMPMFEEHMENIEKEASIGKKYYEQARAHRNRWVEIAREELKKAEELEPNGMQICTNLDGLREDKTGTLRPEWRPIDISNQADMTKFDEYKQEKIEGAKRQIEEDENTNLDELAKCYKNQELIGQIATKLNKDEDFTREELDFLGDIPESLGEIFNFKGEYDIPAVQEDIHRHGFIVGGFTYGEILNNPRMFYPEWVTIIKAQMREMTKQDQALLASNEEIQNSLKDMEERRTKNPFAGETNINSETGEARTFTLEDDYPRLENESEEDYRNRLKRIGLKTRLAEKRHNQ